MRNENLAVNQAAETEPLTRRRFMGVAAMLAPELCGISPEGAALSDPTTKQANLDEHNLSEEIKKEKIRRTMPPCRVPETPFVIGTLVQRVLTTQTSRFPLLTEIRRLEVGLPH